MKRDAPKSLNILKTSEYNENASDYMWAHLNSSTEYDKDWNEIEMNWQLRMEEPKKRWWKKTSIFFFLLLYFIFSFLEFVFELIFAVYILNFCWFSLKYSNPKQIICSRFECEFPFWWSALFSTLSIGYHFWIETVFGVWMVEDDGYKVFSIQHCTFGWLCILWKQ